ncbi:N-acetylmuramic acid 6-phosphate etherase [Acidithiobacillus thiooxidans]|uniref:N-acetylmuramic acid 6-phosphate etherase n=1 Tax=Acidithiobacillus thiooxidans ATCC 19377 TaxID=637390 RepID=A0A543PZZ4_ACITH|nr:N-acetylmuramic acid 6-phosphate etherase [Acidithiobacillus thiooxidans]MDX5936352.1 N-acetylmuramic acid 6-phosphate etherase [Acidithiobacillus thiooxidans]TQN49647.1 N-acetylmuramic acid 6-phosphate etherase [Acidithiobacillus thiooxidans ATCC 19377]
MSILYAGSTESCNDKSKFIDLLTTNEIIKIINQEDQFVAQAVANESEKIVYVVDEITQRIRLGGRLFYIGAGTSGRLGVLDASECPPTFSVEHDLIIGIIAGGDKALRHAIEGAEDSENDGHKDLTNYLINENDSVIGISASGNTPYVLGALHYAKRKGAFTIGLCNNQVNKFSSIAHMVIIPIVGPEIITGSTRMKAGTAQKLVLNTISTAVMIKLGKVYGNLMVDLKVSNAKLLRRAISIVRQVCQINDADSLALLERCQFSPKVAIVCYLGDYTPEQAKVKLDQFSGNIREALKFG